jgi:hypothetical protein
VLATYPLGNPQSLSLSGSTIVVADNGIGLRTFDVTDPIAPVEKGTLSSYNINYAVVRGNNAYYMESGLFSVADVTDLDNPVLKGSCTVGYWGKLDVKDNWAYVTDYYNYSLIPIDVSVPETPLAMTPVGGISGWTYDMAITPERLYVASIEGIDIFNLADPGLPVKTTTFASYGYSAGLAYTAATLFSTYYYGNQIYSWDIATDPDNPTQLGTAQGGSGYYSGHMAIVGNYLYMVQSYEIVVFDVTSPAGIQYVASLAVQGATDIVTDGTVLYAVGLDVNTYEGWLKVII